MAVQYLVLKNIRISNANAIAGFTYGFPAVTHFLGYVHALSRKLQKSHGIRLDDVGIMCHQHQVHAYRENQYEPFSFALTRNPLTKEGKTAPINEEGRMHLTVSLVINASGINTVDEHVRDEQCLAIKELAERHKLAGGQVISIESCKLAKSHCHKVLLRRLLPGFVLRERSDLLAEKNEKSGNSLENWLEFSALKFAATDEPVDETEENGKVKWEKVVKPKGYLVPIQIGYKQIAPTYSAGEVANARDNQTPMSFVEPVHSIAEWIGAPSKLESIQEIMWRYNYQPPFYICSTQQASENTASPQNIQPNVDMI
ncbi:type I-F CRISPR-associated protein Csy2 [Vibrio caribbeanicus]|uniref:type I-F CRISPR-associated protein Csy2 n=1 Tax=Vibrio caribbeanicus TaxID=701175 RepID=UPI002283624F|nr:type I-F CRISPR-associated protein Csy2 [Vibrio caribbeanicus]MCY9843448.1 type I-F CRISPR-associated protein Csy2 [Vibrio caribbeanicus]